MYNYPKIQLSFLRDVLIVSHVNVLIGRPDCRYKVETERAVTTTSHFFSDSATYVSKIIPSFVFKGPVDLL